MSAAEIVLLILAVLALVGVVLWSVAQRLDRLHRREFQTRAVLEAQLVRRADIAAEVAADGLLDPASAVLVADAALGSMRAARIVGDDDSAQARAERGLVESELTRTLRTALDETDPGLPPRSPEAAEAIDRLRHSHDRVQLARRFHNDAVVQIHHIRRLTLVRLFRLAGRAALPRTFEMDDAPV
ncbi:MAG TPA: hypothetical protein VK063_03435 [Beutenbergiaceae bacterium]|nr:hypothetical protein [Beutenbergiaceae bacterium]